MTVKQLSLSAPVVCVVGPTASGKTDLAQALALELGGEVISADSMQIYKGMDIGTGKLPPTDRLVAHHGLDIVEPGQPYSAALFQAFARKCISDIDSRGSRCVLAGGTGFYVRAVIDGYDFPKGEQLGNPIREQCMRIASDRGPKTLWDLLAERDPASADLIAPADVKRVARAFELLAEGESYAKQRVKLATLPQVIPAVMLGIDVDPDMLRLRIDARVDAMMEAGLVNEVEGLLKQGFREGITAPQAIGYKEIVAALDGKISLDEAVENIKLATKRYAKRQRTWFRKDARIHWLHGDGQDTTSLADEALKIIGES